MSTPVATVAGTPISVDEVDEREVRLRNGFRAATLPISSRAVASGNKSASAGASCIARPRAAASTATTRSVTISWVSQRRSCRPSLVPLAGSVAAAVLADPRARALFAAVTADVEVSDDDVADYHARNPLRFAPPRPVPHGWRAPADNEPPLQEVRTAIAEHLRGAARRRAFRMWLDARRAALVQLAPGYEHPGDPRQPDNTHRH